MATKNILLSGEKQITLIMTLKCPRFIFIINVT